MFGECPHCEHKINVYSFPWMTTTDRKGQKIRRRMGPCPNCKIWLKPLVGESLLLETVDPYEVDHVEKE